MKSFRLFLLAAIVSLAAACSSPTGPERPQEKEPPPEPDPTQGMVITPQHVGIWV